MAFQCISFSVVHGPLRACAGAAAAAGGGRRARAAHLHRAGRGAHAGVRVCVERGGGAGACTASLVTCLCSPPAISPAPQPVAWIWRLFMFRPPSSNTHAHSWPALPAGGPRQPHRAGHWPRPKERSQPGHGAPQAAVRAKPQPSVGVACCEGQALREPRAMAAGRAAASRSQRWCSCMRAWRHATPAVPIPTCNVLLRLLAPTALVVGSVYGGRECGDGETKRQESEGTVRYAGSGTRCSGCA